MKTTKKNPIPAAGYRQVTCGTCAIALLWLPTTEIAAVAEDVIASPPATAATPSAVQEHQSNNPMQVFAPLPSGSGMGTPVEPFRWGPVTLRPHVNYRFLYATGVQYTPGQTDKTTVQQISPGLQLDLGTHWSLNYTPTLNYYSSDRLRDTLDHNAQLNWGGAYGSWFFHASQDAIITSDPQIETAAQNDRENYLTLFRATHPLNSKWALDFNLRQDFNYISSSSYQGNYSVGLANSRTWSTMDWLNYQFWPRLNAGAGLGLGYGQQDQSPDALFERYQARVAWRATDKVSVQLSGGLEDRQHLSGNSSDLVTPIMEGSLQYQPFTETQLSLIASRTVSSSVFQNQVAESTLIRGQLDQRLLGKFHLNLGGGYRMTKYDATVSDSATSRQDDYYMFDARLTSSFAKRGTFSVFFQYSENASSESGFLAPGSSFNYTSRQVGVEIGYRY